MNIASDPKDQINLAFGALQIPSRRSEFLHNPSKYAKKENVRLDPTWIKVIEEEVEMINKKLSGIEGKFDRKAKV
jgi:hypothetical protein